MSIRAIAQELYKCQARVHALEDRLAQATLHEKDEISRQLRGARQELRLLKSMLEGRKAQSLEMKNRYFGKR